MNKGTKSGMDALMKAIEADMYYGVDKMSDSRAREKLIDLLYKLKIKSARQHSAALRIESLQEVLRQMTTSFGRPSQIFMDPNALNVYKNNYGSGKEEDGTDDK